MSRPIIALLRTRLRADRRAAVAVIVAVSAMPLMGVAAIVVDLGYAYVQRTSLQQAADSAALAGAMAYNAKGTLSAVEQTVQDVVVANGWPANSIQAPASEYLATSPKNSSMSAVQVSLSVQVPLTFGQLITRATTLSVGVKSVVQLGGGTVPCVIALQQLIFDVGINAGKCEVAADGSMSNSVLVNGGSTITATTVSGYGGITNNGTITGNKVTGKTVSDPYKAVQSMSSLLNGTCIAVPNLLTYVGGLLPGICYNLQPLNSGTVTLSLPGVYYLNNLQLNSGTGLVATAGVTIIAGGNFSQNGNLTITAPTAGTTAGVAIYYTGNNLNINTGVQYAINGAVYAPNAQLNIDSGTFNANDCTYLVANNITFNGGTFTLPQTGCSGVVSPTGGGGGTSVALIE